MLIIRNLFGIFLTRIFKRNISLVFKHLFSFKNRSKRNIIRQFMGEKIIFLAVFITKPTEKQLILPVIIYLYLTITLQLHLWTSRLFWSQKMKLPPDYRRTTTKRQNKSRRRCSASLISPEVSWKNMTHSTEKRAPTSQSRSVQSTFACLCPTASTMNRQIWV